MTGFELQTPGVGSDRSTNCATTTAVSYLDLFANHPPLFSKYKIAYKSSIEMIP